MFSDKIYLTNEIKIAKDAAFVQHLNFSEKINANFMYAYVNGMYKNIDKSKIFKIDMVYYFDRKNDKVGIVTGISRKKILSFIKITK